MNYTLIFIDDVSSKEKSETINAVDNIDAILKARKIINKKMNVTVWSLIKNEKMYIEELEV